MNFISAVCMYTPHIYVKAEELAVKVQRVCCVDYFESGRVHRKFECGGENTHCAEDCGGGSPVAC